MARDWLTGFIQQAGGQAGGLTGKSGAFRTEIMLAKKPLAFRCVEPTAH
jgi:hypothetical protein